MSDGFIGRWSQRKLDLKKGKVVDAEPVVVAVPVAATVPVEATVPPPQPAPSGAGGQAGLPPEAPPPPTLEDVQALTGESDFSRFTASNVSPEVKNAAMKKLFSDPHYNVMDGLDIYTGDYSQPDPIPYAMLRGLASAKFLNLFHKEEKEEAEAAAEEAAAKEGTDASVAAAAQPRDDADNPTVESVAKSEAAPPAVPESPEHADPDLRLQQDHAAAGKAPGHGTG